MGFLDKISGTLGGAVTGFLKGGPAGALVGGGLGLVGDLTKKKKKKNKLFGEGSGTVSSYDPLQQELYKNANEGIMNRGPLADVYGFNADQANNNFDLNIQNPALRNYRENIVPTITGQFRKDNLMNSSYAGEALAREGRNVQENLNAGRANYIYNQEQASKDRRQRGIESILGSQTFAYNQPQTQNSPIDSILNTFGGEATGWLTDKLGGFFGGKTSTPSTPSSNIGNYATLGATSAFKR